MKKKEPELQELIVRALTGRDRRAREALDRAAASDPELKQFRDELEEVVALLGGSKDWRRRAPSAELARKVRAAVAAKLPAAPPHFSTVLLEADLGRRRAARRWIVGLALGALFAAGLAWLWQQRRTPSGLLKLSGRVAFEAALRGGPLSGWERAGEGEWRADAEGLRNTEGVRPGALFRRKGYGAERALAFNLDVRLPDLDEETQAVVFLADAARAPGPAFHPGARPARAVGLELTRESLVLLGPHRELLHSKPRAQAGAAFYRLRIEYLGSRLRVLVNGKRFFEGPLQEPLRGPLHPGMRVSGAQKAEIRFNAARVER